MEKNQDDLSGAEQKVNEYVGRYNKGEALESIMNGLSAHFRDAIEKKIYSQETVEKSEKNELSSEQVESIKNFQNFQDAEALKNAITSFVPQKYHDFIEFPDILEEMWSERYYVDSEITKREKENRAYALSLVKQLSEKTIKDISHSREKEKIRELQSKLTGEGTREKNIQNEIFSKDLENDLIHTYENPEEGVSVTFWNNDKHQDAFAIKDKTYVVADGAGSYEKSGVVSSILSEKLATLASKAGSFEEFQSIFQESNFESILNDIQSSEAYKSFKPDRKFKKEGEGLATFVVAKESLNGKDLEYASIGDSPLFVIDKNEKGEVIGFELVNDSFGGSKINQDNFYNPEVINYLNNPETELVGVRKDGSTETDFLSKVKFGKIAKKEGRSVVLASDSIIKMMLNSPHAHREMAKSKKDKPVVQDAFNKKADSEQGAYEDLWDKNGNLNFDFFSSNKNMLNTLNKWKENNYNYSDDLTLITISV